MENNAAAYEVSALIHCAKYRFLSSKGILQKSYEVFSYDDADLILPNRNHICE
jgi:hypothetical protein